MAYLDYLVKITDLKIVYLKIICLDYLSHLPKYYLPTLSP